MNGAHGRWGRRQGGHALVAAVVAVVVAAIAATAAQPATAGKASRTNSMSIAGGATYARTASVTVGSAVSQAATMRLMNSGGAWSSWMPYAASVSWTLAAGDGDKTVQAQYRLSTGKTVALSDGVTLDGTAPATTTDYTGVTAPWVTVTFAAHDALSGVAATNYRIDGGSWRQGSTADLYLHRKRSGLAAGQHTVEYYSTDSAGNVEAVHSLTVTLGA